MKKLLTIFCSLTFVGASASQIIACTTKPKLKIVFVPSQDASKTELAIKKLQKALPDILKSKLKKFDYKVEIYSSTSYEAAGESISQGKDAVAFLPIGTYTSYRGDKKDDGTYSKLGLLANVGREALTPEVNVFKDQLNENEKELNVGLQNSSNFDISYKIVKSYYDVKHNKQNELGKQAWTKEMVAETFWSKEYIAPYYRSLIYANKSLLDQKYKDKTYRDALISSKADHVKAVFDLIDSTNKQDPKRIHFSKSLTSSAGTIYPLWYLYNLAKENGKTDKEARDWVADIYRGHPQQTDYNNARKLAATGPNITVGFGDIRIDEVNEPDEVMRNVDVIAAGNPIHNDGIQYSRAWFKGRDDLLAALRDTFSEMIKDTNYRKDIFDIYNHKSYLVPEKGKEKEWEISFDKTVTDVISDPGYQNVKEIIKAIKG